MNMFKKATLASAMLAALGLGLASSAQAVVFYNGGKTLVQWSANSPVSDADGDSTWSLLSNDPAMDLAHISLTEIILLGKHFYTAAFDFTPLPDGGLLAGEYSVKYSVTLNKEKFIDVGIDSTVVGSHPPDTTVVKNVYSDAEMTQLLTSLTSLNGDQAGPTAFTGSTIYVEDLFTVGEGTLVTNAANEFTAQIPEPGTMMLLGASLLGLARSRRKLAACV